MQRQSPDLTIWEQRVIRQWRALSSNRRVSNRRDPASSGGSSLRHNPVRVPPDKLTPAELDQAAADLLVLQRGLTGERQLIGSAYMDENRRLGAYLLFYWFTSYIQTWAMLQMAQTASMDQPRVDGTAVPWHEAGISPAFQAGDEGSKEAVFRILDLGSGPAPCGLAAADWYKATFQVSKIELIACDQSPLALRIAEELAQSAGPTLRRVGPWRAGLDTIPTGTFNCIVIGHLLNELWNNAPDRIEHRKALIAELGDHLKEGGILLILEPALLGTGRDLLVLRDQLVNSGWLILAPCFTQGLCPAVVQPNQTCHSDFIWEPPQLVRELEQRTGLDKDLVKTTALVLTRTKDRPITVRTDTEQVKDAVSHIPLPSGNLYRVVSEPMFNKAGRTRFILCGKQGRLPLSARLGDGYPAESIFKQLRRSDAIYVDKPEQRETGFALGPETRITRL